MKKTLRENPDAGLVAIVLFFLIAVIVGMWIYQAKIMQRHSNPANPIRTVEGTPRFQSLVLHGELNPASSSGNQNNPNQQPDRPVTLPGDTRQNKTHKTNPSLAEAPGYSSTLPGAKTVVQSTCGNNAGSPSYANCLDETLSSAESLVNGL